MRVLLSAYACDPDGASEAANAWFTAASLALRVNVEVLTTQSMRDRVERGICDVRREGGTISAQYLSDDSPFASRIGMLGTFTRYASWQRRARAWVTDASPGRWDVAHHISWGSATLPIGVSAAPCPLVIGPLGGGQRLSPDHYQWFDGPLGENRLRNTSLRSLRFNPLSRGALASAQSVLVTNSATMALVEPHTRGAQPELFLAEGIPDGHVLTSAPPVPTQPNVVWLGRFLPRKAASLAVHAFELLSHQDPDVTLTFVGEGPARARVQTLARDLGLAHRIRFAGGLRWQEAQDVLAAATVHLFSSVRDSSSAQTLEAASLGVPTVTLDLAGANDFLHRPGFSLVDPHPGTSLPDRIARTLADVINWSPQKRTLECEGALAFAREQTWTARCERLRSIYQASVLS